MISIIFRALIIYFFLILMMKFMGKRQLGELDVGDLVTTLLVSELGAMPIDDPDIPILNALIPILIIVSLEILISTLKNKSERLKKMFDGEPVFIIYKGRLLEGALRDNRISLNELLSAVRSSGIGDLGEVGYCLVEPNGTLSVIKKGEVFQHPVIIDGEMKENIIRRMGQTPEYVRHALGGTDIKDVFLMTLDDDGGKNIIKRKKSV